MIYEAKRLNELDLSGMTNREKMEILWLVAGQKGQWDTKVNNWLEMGSNKNLVPPIRHLAKDFVTTKAMEEYGDGDHSLEEFFARKTLKVLDTILEEIAKETRRWTEVIKTGIGVRSAKERDHKFHFTKITVRNPVIMESLVDIITTRKENFLIQYSKDKNIFVGGTEIKKILFSQGTGKEFRFTKNHQDFYDDVIDKIAKANAAGTIKKSIEQVAHKN
ncbi:MAG: hypothetical protein NT165_03180 [Candidatus Falkowbacteria bacterium]|nr:hypothetical protein [Candidatus Falkowbacteria bacterium]